jgi:hypothetical protein
MRGQQLRCENKLAVVSGATHLIKEPGTLATVADLAEAFLGQGPKVPALRG